MNWCLGGGIYPEGGALTLQYKIDHLHNYGMYPVAIARACMTGAYAKYGGPQYDCIAERMNVYSPDAGYLAYLGSYKEAGLYSTLPGEYPRYIYEWIPYAIYHDLSTILGECVLEARLHMTNSTDPWHFMYNLFGDPAVNMMAKGYEITQDITLPSSTTISTKIYLRDGSTLTIPNGGTLEFTDNGQLVIDDGATLAIGHDVRIKGQREMNKIEIEGCMTGIGGTITNAEPIMNLELSSLEENSWEGLSFNNGDLSVVLTSGSISNCNVTGQIRMLRASSCSINNSEIDLKGCNFNFENATFTNAGINLYNNTPDRNLVTVSGCDFTDSPFESVISLSHFSNYVIENNTITYSNGAGINLSYSGGADAREKVVQNNRIQKSGNPQDLSWGIKVYHSFADIFNNRITNNAYGIATMNMSSVKVLGNSGATNYSETQQIYDNFKSQVRSFDNSFPYEFHYNVINNSLSSDPLIYYDNSLPSPNPIEGMLNIKCNCLPTNPVLFPPTFYSWEPTWCPPSSCNGDDPGKGEFEQAQIFIDSGNFELAESQLKDLILTYSDSKYANEAAKKLIPLKELSDQDYSGLKNFYNTTSVLHNDSLVDMLTDHLKTRCDIEQKAYETAINWYENEIVDPVSLDDSIYSIIDLQDTYMLMFADSIFKTPHNVFTGKLIQYRPSTFYAYQTNKEVLIKLLFTEKVLPGPHSEQLYTDNNGFILYQNHPNPFSSETEVTYQLPCKSEVEIVGLNLLGQEVFTLNKSQQEKGEYSQNVKFGNLSAGVYYIILRANGFEKARIKVIKQN